MFRDAGSGLQVYCDDEAQVLRVATDTPLIAGYLGTWRELGAFKSREEWLKSSFHNRVTNEGVKEMIEWFWMDLEEATGQKLKKFVCRWCGKAFESKLGLFCPHCCRFQSIPRVLT
jgi:hypothetical protein